MHKKERCFHHSYPTSGNFLIRTWYSSATAKLPAQSLREVITVRTRRTVNSGERGANRNNTTPEDAGNRDRNANSPKSLSKVRRMRLFATARFKTVWSSIPGESARTHATSCPMSRNASTTSRGKCSFAKNRMWFISQEPDILFPYVTIPSRTIDKRVYLAG